MANLKFTLLQQQRGHTYTALTRQTAGIFLALHHSRSLLPVNGMFFTLRHTTAFVQPVPCSLA